MTASKPRRMGLQRRALRITQTGAYPLYVFALRADEILQIADISRVSRDSAGKLIGYQRPEVRRHIQEIVEYLDSDKVIFPNPIIMALSSRVEFKTIRGNRLDDDGLGITGTLTIPAPAAGRSKPAWIVDGQQRAVAMSRMRRPDMPVPVVAFVADTVELQRDQFLRINNTRPLPRGLVTELLPEVDSPLPARLAIRRAPSAICDVLNTNPSSPFHGMIKRASTAGAPNPNAVITDTAIVDMIKLSMNSSAGCLYLYRDINQSETDYEGILRALVTYWTAVRDTFPDAWGKPPEQSRLMHGAGICAMGRLMDHILAVVDVQQPNAIASIRQHLEVIAPRCRWTAGSWEDLGTQWNRIQNTGHDIQMLSNYLIRTYVAARTVLR